MKNILKATVLLITLATLVACGNKDAATGDAATPSASAPAATANAITFVSSQDDKPMAIDVALFDTSAAKEFLATGKNPYVGNEEAIAKGKKVYGLYSCSQCHGPTAQGQVGPGLVGPTFKYPKNATNKGMFETIWVGTNGGMGGKGVGIMNPANPADGVRPDEALQVIAWIRSQGSEGLTGNE
ncbi:MAG: c-type cytochrome [Methylophilaceae bacterium]